MTKIDVEKIELILEQIPAHERGELIDGAVVQAADGEILLLVDNLISSIPQGPAEESIDLVDVLALFAKIGWELIKTVEGDGDELENV